MVDVLLPSPPTRINEITREVRPRICDEANNGISGEIDASCPFPLCKLIFHCRKRALSDSASALALAIGDNLDGSSLAIASIRRPYRSLARGTASRTIVRVPPRIAPKLTTTSRFVAVDLACLAFFLVLGFVTLTSDTADRIARKTSIVSARSTVSGRTSAPSIVISIDSDTSQPFRRMPVGATLAL